MSGQETPKNSVGKLDEKVLREHFKDWRPAEERAAAGATLSPP